MGITLPIKKTKQFICSNSDCEEEFYEELLIENLEHISSDYRQMGTENQYEFESEVKCPSCGNIIELTGDIWEYPEGTINSIQVNR